MHIPITRKKFVATKCLKTDDHEIPKVLELKASNSLASINQ